MVWQDSFMGYAGFWFGITCCVLWFGLVWGMFGNPLDSLREQLAHSWGLFKYVIRMIAPEFLFNLASKSCSALFSYKTLLYMELGWRSSQIGRHPRGA